MPSYYAFSILLSAFLLFQIQPMIGKTILPWFGGTPTVWSTVLLFFQVLLTAGYAYAYWLLGRVRGRWQGTVHLGLLALSLALLLATALLWRSPLTPPASWRPLDGDFPVWDIFRVLAVSVGIPYFLLATNSTLMQAWFSRDHAQQTPYRLYALSNAGSLVALVSYPLIFEPLLTLRTQAYLWTAGYTLFVAVAAYLAWRITAGRAVAEQPGTPESQLGAEKRSRLGVYALWLGLAACATTLLMAVTNQVTQEVAVIPFLWVLPLTVYLLTFILAFAGGRWYSRRPYLAAFFILSLISLWMLVKNPPFSISAQLIVYTLLLFSACMLCHNELFRLRPHPRGLSSFYLMVALGGALGGIFVTLAAPLLFTTGFWELQWGLVACGILLTLVLQADSAPVVRKRGVKASVRHAAPRRFKPAVFASAAAVFVLGLLIVLIMRAISTDTLVATRNFYGVLRVWEINTAQPELLAYQLTHGRTAHGFQFAANEIRKVPTAYYSEPSGVGLAIANHPARPGPLRVGALGLGIGIIASYGQPGDVYRFYEINPDIIRIAQGEDGRFSFLRDSDADIQIVPGDARVSLEREWAASGSQRFDLLVLDTFSGDTIPLHLLTQEAFAIYQQHLNPGGVIAINVSNRIFDLSQAVYRLADEFQLSAVLIEHPGDRLQSYDSLWMLLSRELAFLQLPAIASRSTPRPASQAAARLWTDDYSNLLQIIR